MSILSVLFALLVFGVLIAIHELGHFLVARAFGVKILEFSIGMGPKILSRTSRKSGTQYSLRLFPIGGYVNMYGEDGMELAQGPQPKEPSGNSEESIFFNDISEKNAENTVKIEKMKPIDPDLAQQAYCNKSVWVRILISLAGPLMNILLGFILMLILVISSGQNAVASTRIAGFYVVYHADESYADLQDNDYLYSLKTDDGDVRILSLAQFREAVRQSEDGTVTFTVLRLNEDGSDTVDPLPEITAYFDDESIDRYFQASLSSSTGDPSGLQPGDVVLKVNRTAVHTYAELSYEILNQGYRPVTFTVRRNGEKVVLKDVVLPTYISENIAFGDMDFIVYREANFGVGTVLKHTWYRSLSTVKMVYDSIKGLFTRRYGFEAVSGPIGITKTISDVAKSGQKLNLLYIVIVISINLGIMNLLPFPALDGGHLLLYLVEAVRRKPIKREVEGIINFIGLILILALAVVIAIKDVISL